MCAERALNHRINAGKVLQSEPFSVLVGWEESRVLLISLWF